MKLSKTMVAMLAVLVLSALATVLELHGRRVRGAEAALRTTPSNPAAGAAQDPAGAPSNARRAPSRRVIVG